MPDSPDDGRSRVARLLPADSAVARALHVFVLATLAVAQPLWEVLGANPEFYVSRRADRTEIVAAALLLLLVPPVATLAVEGATALVNRRAGRIVHAAAVCGFATLFFLRLFTRTLGDPPLAVVALAAFAAIGVTAYYLTTTGARRVLTALGPAPLLLLALFLFTSEVKPLVLPSAAAEAGTVAFRRKPPVVFLVFDEFPLRGILDRDLTISEERAPNLAAFAKTSTWYRKATTVHEVSEMAVPAILTGIRSEKKQLPTAANFPINLFSVFTSGGYDVRAAEVLTRLCTKVTCGEVEQQPRLPLKARVKSQLKDLGVVYGHQVLPDSMATESLPDIGLTWGNFAAPPPAEDVGPGGVREDINDAQEPRLEAFLASLTPSLRPTLHYAHLLMPHAPFTHTPEGVPYVKNRSFIGINMKTGYWDNDEFVTDQAEQRNLMQVTYTDRQIGRIFGTLKQAGIWDDALVVVTSDHGSVNRPKLNRRAFAPESMPDVAPVPLFVKLPGQAQGSVSDVNAQTVDVLPTVADALGFTIPGEVDGLSLLGDAARPAERTLIDQFGNVDTLSAALPELQAGVDHMYSRFAHEGDRLNLYATGPYQGLVGTTVDRYGTGSGRYFATLVNPEFWTTGAPPGTSPSHQTGTLDGARADTHLVVTVDGVVVATSRSYDTDGDRGKLDMFVPDSVLAPGHAEVRLYAVSGDPASPAVTPVELVRR